METHLDVVYILRKVRAIAFSIQRRNSGLFIKPFDYLLIMMIDAARLERRDILCLVILSAEEHRKQNDDSKLFCILKVGSLICLVKAKTVIY